MNAVIFLLLLCSVLMGSVIFLIWVSVRLKREIAFLRADLFSHNSDLAQLCQASLAVDRHLAEHDLRFHRLSEKFRVSEYQA